MIQLRSTALFLGMILLSQARELAAAPAAQAGAALSGFEAASGGARWRRVTTLRFDGTLKAGGLSGEFKAGVDLASGRSFDDYRLGPVDGADGFDGTQVWERDPGGEVAALDTPESLQRARTQAWLDSRSYWFPGRIAASYANVTTRKLDGKSYRVIEARPAGGQPVTLWIAVDSHLLTRIVQHQDADIATTVLEDYRRVDGLRLPFRIVTDLTDAAGRTDPRRRTEIVFAAIRVNATIADAEFSMPAMAPSAHIDAADGRTSVGFDLVNNHIYVDGAIDGKPARLLVDTGGVNLLTPAAAAKFGLEGAGKLAAGGTGEERADLGFARAKEVRVGAAALAGPTFFIIDLGALPRIEGVEFDGLVGYEIFRRFAVEIDYEHRRLTLIEPAAFTPPVGAAALDFRIAERIPVISAELDGMPVELSVDTGARDSLTLNSPFVRDHDLVARYAAAAEGVTGWGVGGPARARPARFGVLKLGGLEVGGIAGALFTGDKGSFASRDQAGNLGAGVLRRFTVSFDYAHRKMYLAPNAEFGKPDYFDRSGLWLFADGDALRVVDVARGSAAEHAGILVDDRVTEIGGAAVSTRSLSDWRRQLREQNAGTALAIRFRRADQILATTLTLSDRIPDTSQAIDK